MTSKLSKLKTMVGLNHVDIPIKQVVILSIPEIEEIEAWTVWFTLSTFTYRQVYKTERLLNQQIRTMQSCVHAEA